MKVVGEPIVQHFIDHFEKHKVYNNFAKFWASWNAQAMLQHLREVYTTLDVTVLEEKFGGPTSDRLDMATAEEVAQEAPQVAEVEVENGTIVLVE